MAEYVPYIQEVFPEPALYTPDFNAISRFMTMKQGMFEQGLSKARSAYNTVISAPLMDPANVAIRDKFVQDAKKNLQTLASADLSLPQNVAAAQNIFAPFWEDNMILQDYSTTKWYQNQMQTLDSWRNSTDPKIREQYNGITEKYLMNGFEKLRNANRDPEAYKQLEKRKAVPFTNIQSWLSEQAKLQELEVKYDDPNGPYLVETINGKRSQKKYATWAKSMIGNNFYDQFQVTGVVEKEERAKAIRSINPNLTDKEVNSIIAKDVVGELDQGFTRRNTELDVELARVESLISSVAKSNNPANEGLFNNLITERSNLLSEKAGLNEEYKYFDQPYKDKKMAEVQSNPNVYFATLAKQRLIDNWAAGRASIDSKLVKENSAWANAESARMRQMEYNLKVQEAQWNRDQDLWERANPKTGQEGKGRTLTGLKDKDGNDIVIQPGQDVENSLMYRGFSGVDITRNKATALELFNNLQQQDYKDSHDLIFDQRGILRLAKNLGLTETEISHVATAFQKEVSSGGDHKFTKEQVQATNKLSAALLANEGVKKSGVTKLTGYGTVRNALIAYAKDYFEQRNNLSKDGNDVPLDQDDFESLMRYMTAVQKLDRYNKNEKNRVDLIQKNVLNNPEFSKLVVDRNGKKDLISISDLAKEMPSLELRDKATREIVKFSKNDVARLFMEGKLSQTRQQELNIDGRNFFINKFNDIESSVLWDSLPNLWNDVYNNKLKPKYGDSSEFSKLLTKAQDSVVPDLLMYKNQSGRQGTAWTLYFMPNKTMGQGDKAAVIVDQALNTANADIFDDNKENPQRLDTKTMDGIRALLKSEKNMEDFISAEYIPQGINGQRTVRLTFSSAISNTSGLAIGDLKLEELSGKTFNVVIKDGVTAPALDNLPNSTGYQIYDMLGRGRTYESDPVVAASGFKFSLTPNVLTSEEGADEEPSYVTLDLEYNVRENKKDPKTGQITTKVKPIKYSTKFNLKGENAKSPDEIVSYLYELYYKNLLTNRQAQQDYQTHVTTANEGAGAANYQDRLRQLGLENLIK